MLPQESKWVSVNDHISHSLREMLSAPAKHFYDRTGRDNISENSV